MATVTFDLATDARLETAAADVGLPNRFERRAWVSAINTTSKYEAMFLARQAIDTALASDGFAAAHPEYAPRRVILDSASDTDFSARLIYETIVFGVGIPPSTFVLTDGAMLTTEETNQFIDADAHRRKISTAWDDPNFLSGAPSIPEDLIKGHLFMPWRVIQVDALIYGRPTKGQQFIGCVNDNTWPSDEPSFAGYPQSSDGPAPLPRGYWILAEYVTRLSVYSGYFTLTAKAMSRVNRDWSETAILIDTNTGRYVQVGATEALGDTIIDNLNAAQYENTITQGDDPNDPQRDTGVCRYGPYKLADFASLFGF